MYVYRAMSSDELINIINGVNSKDILHKGLNTFKYEQDVDYIHFYKYAQHAFINSHMFGTIVAKIKLDDNIIPPLEYGIYTGIKTDYDDTLSLNNFPIPEIVIDRKLFSNNNIIGFSNAFTENFQRSEDGNFPLSFYVSKKNILGMNQLQEWDIHSIYYEYVKSLFPLFDNSGISVALYLKTIDLDKELMKFAEVIKSKKLIVKKRKRKLI